MATHSQTEFTGNKDPFTEYMSRMVGNPEALNTRSVVRSTDFMGYTETWVVETWKAEGEFRIALERIGASGTTNVRIMMPPDVTKLLFSHADRLNSQVAKRAGKKAAMTRQSKQEAPMWN